MKKIFAVFSVLVLSSCWSGGKLELFDWRKNWIETMGAYDIDYFDQGPKLLKTEVRTEKNYVPNKVLTAYKGYSIADIKTYRKDVYASTMARINKKGALHSSAAPIMFEKNDQRPVIGMTEIDDVSYFLIPSKINTFYHLVKDDGEFYPKMGQIRHDKLLLIDPEYFQTPADLRFEPVTTTASEQTEPIKGFDIKYEGVKKDRILFTYFDYSSVGGDRGQFENLSFMNREGTINIKGVKVKILGASDQKIDYSIVE